MDRSFFTTFIEVAATWFGCGRAPRAPGTFGTLGAIPLFWVMSTMSPLGYMGATLVLVVLSILVAHFYEEIRGEHDSPEFVFDEVVGFLVTMTWVPWGWKGVVAGFVLFRLFDVAKPFPISWLDRRVPGGVGAVADDLLAGIFSNIILQILLQRGWL
jgi:phosphatidylglycerophosphatase A